MKHLTLNDVQPVDYKFIVEKPDKDFSPEKNYRVINSVIAKSLKLEAELGKILNLDAENRVDYLSSYICYVNAGGGQKFEKFMGKENMRKIYGERILEKVRIMDSITRMNRAKGNTKYEKFVLN